MYEYAGVCVLRLYQIWALVLAGPAAAVHPLPEKQGLSWSVSKPDALFLPSQKGFLEGRVS
jgi:hypothetical protein